MINDGNNDQLNKQLGMKVACKDVTTEKSTQASRTEMDIIVTCKCILIR